MVSGLSPIARFYAILREVDFKASALYDAVVKTFGRYLWGRE